MSNEIGYGAAAIRAGEVKYQQAMVDMLKKAAAEPKTADVERTQQSKPADEKVGRNLDIKA